MLGNKSDQRISLKGYSQRYVYWCIGSELATECYFFVRRRIEEKLKIMMLTVFVCIMYYTTATTIDTT